MFDNPLAPDTPLEVTRYQYDVLEKLGPAGRAQLAMRLSDSLRRFVEAGVRMRHPEYSNRQVQLAGLRLAWGDALFRKVYPDVDIKT